MIARFRHRLAAASGTTAWLHAMALASGALAALALPPADAGALGLVAWVPWMLALARAPRVRDAALSGALHVAAWNAMSCSWLITTMTGPGGLSLAIALPSFGAALLILAPYGLVPGVVAGAACRRWGPAGLATLPLAFAGLDALRCRLPLGFPWSLAGMTQADGGPLLPIAELFGVHGVSAAVLATNAVIALVVASSSARGRTAPLAFAALLALLPLSRLAVRPSELGPVPAASSLVSGGSAGISAAASRAGWDAPSEAGAVRVALVQAAIPQEVVLHPDAASETERLLLQLDLTEQALDAGAELVVWSESSYPATVEALPWAWQRLLALLARHPRAHVVVGGLVNVPGGGDRANVTNSALLADALGLTGRYDKRWLVPFGEYMPAERVFFWFRRLTTAVGDMRAGTSADPLPGPALLGTFICYEAVLPQHVAAFVREGAELLVNITNDGWFHGSSAPEQHLRFARVRAVETRRQLVRCANSGISAIIAADGSVVARIEEGQRGVLVATVTPSSVTTPYARMGDAPVAVGGALALAAALLALARRAARQ